MSHFLMSNVNQLSSLKKGCVILLMPYCVDCVCLDLAEGKETERAFEEWKLHIEEVPKALS